MYYITRAIIIQLFQLAASNLISQLLLLFLEETSPIFSQTHTDNTDSFMSKRK